MVLLENNKELQDLLKTRSLPKKVNYVVKSDGFGESPPSIGCSSHVLLFKIPLGLLGTKRRVDSLFID